MLGSVDEEEKKRAEDITRIRRDMLRTRIKRYRDRIKKCREKATKCILNEYLKDGRYVLEQPVCAVCDTVKIGSKELVAMSREELLSKETRIGLGSFQEHYEMELHPELVSQYKRDVLQGLLLLPQARELNNGSVEVCESCRNSLRRSQESPPK